MLTVSELFIYPVKSLGGISLTASEVTDRGFQYDRRWMLVDSEHNFVTQREYSQLALLEVTITAGGLLITHKINSSFLHIPFTPNKETVMVDIWSSRARANTYHKEIDDWFSEQLSLKCRLVYMPDTTRLWVDSRYAKRKEITSFSDGYPFLIIGQASLDDINDKMEEPLPMNRFRPNIVCVGSLPFEEDTWAHFSINQIQFFGVKLSARCVVTTIDQQTAITGKEPLKTLSTYRKLNNKIYFGQNLLHEGKGIIRVGDEICIKETKRSRFS